LEDETGQIVTQGDSLPVAGFRPTTSWREGEVIVDAHMIPIPANLAAGSYRLWVGFYNPIGFERLTPFQNGILLPDGRLKLVDFLISP
jgi:hypothetical protein